MMDQKPASGEDALSSPANPSNLANDADKTPADDRALRNTFIRQLVSRFLAWKLLLLVVAILAPGPGYDTSTQLFFDDHQPPSSTAPSSPWLDQVVEHIVARLTRWDAIYFVSAAERGRLVYEQAWAFSFVFSRLSATASVLLSPLPVSSVLKNALAAVLISNLSHLLAISVLYYLTSITFRASESRGRHFALTTASLHIISPAGIFLSAPYGESTFAFLNFLGMLLYALGIRSKSNAQKSSWTIASGLAFAAATTIRSNGILSGLIYAWDAFSFLLTFPSLLRNRNWSQILAIIPTVIAGSILALGFAIPQAFAYHEYCFSSETPRPWCKNIPPSIYTFVQTHYWDVGFLRYWTAGNIPLFLLATPLAVFMVQTALSAFRNPNSLAATRGGPNTDLLLSRFALPQLVLVLLAFTSYHVQILNRISSGYPLWYIALARAILEEPQTDRAGKNKLETTESDSLTRRVQNKLSLSPEVITRLMVGYAIVQGGLYAAFLPPA